MLMESPVSQENICGASQQNSVVTFSLNNFLSASGWEGNWYFNRCVNCIQSNFI